VTGRLGVVRADVVKVEDEGAGGEKDEEVEAAEEVLEEGEHGGLKAPGLREARAVVRKPVETGCRNRLRRNKDCTPTPSLKRWPTSEQAR